MLVSVEEKKLEILKNLLVTTLEKKDLPIKEFDGIPNEGFGQAFWFTVQLMFDSKTRNSVRTTCT